MSQIQFDLSNVLADAIGPDHGLTMEELLGEQARCSAALAAIQARRETDLRWLDLPYAQDVLDSMLDYASSVGGRFKNIVVLGIGGSALGNTALQSALGSPFHNVEPPPGVARLFVLDNIDPDLVGEFLAHFDPEKTLFNVISKSGGTAETMSQFLIFRARLVEHLGEEGHRDHIVVTTDKENGVLREIVNREGYESFIVPEGVGGRFSVLSPVGLLSSALVGIDVKGLLKGAADMDKRCQTEALMDNPALLYALVQHKLHEEKGLPIAVTFPYSHRLANMAAWYAQLLGESLGKRLSKSGEQVFRGPTPVSAVGVTDQHSQVQLYVEGPFDKWFTLLTVGTGDHEVKIPKTPAPFRDLEGVDYLGGRSLGDLFRAEREGTRIALTDAKRPNASIHFETITAHSVGQYIYMMELAVALMGEFYDVDAFDQPGVEAGKIAAYALMGRAGFEAERERIEAASCAAK
ncbi:MAG: glucose-6-phosphate isomerase [Planctomycetota bacterium]